MLKAQTPAQTPSRARQGVREDTRSAAPTTSQGDTRRIPGSEERRGDEGQRLYPSEGKPFESGMARN